MTGQCEYNKHTCMDDFKETCKAVNIKFVWDKFIKLNVIIKFVIANPIFIKTLFNSRTVKHT